MSDDVSVSDEPITLHESVVEPSGRSPDVKQVQIQQQYIPPLDGTPDELDRFDMWIARRVAEVLVRNYYGYDWFVMAESRQGIVAFSIPDLMGPTLKQVIRLAQFGDLDRKLIRETGGQMLERMGLRRGPKDVAEYEKAKANRHMFDFSDVKQ